MHGVAHAVLHGFAEAQSIDRAWAVLIDLRGGGLPPRESAFTEALNDLAQARHDGFPLHVPSTAALRQPCVQANASCRERSSVRPAGHAQGRGELARCAG
ncbi:hypothetical protein D3C79_822120 [compost metagenome]